MFIFPKIHLKGMKPDKKGKPAKKNGDWTTSWAKIFLIMGCILFVGVFVMSYFMPVITELIAPVKAQPGIRQLLILLSKMHRGVLYLPQTNVSTTRQQRKIRRSGWPNILP